MAQKQWTALCAVPVGASKISFCLNVVDPGRIELPPRQCECRVIPLNHGPLLLQLDLEDLEAVFLDFLFRPEFKALCS